MRNLVWTIGRGHKVMAGTGSVVLRYDLLNVRLSHISLVLRILGQETKVVPWSAINTISNSPRRLTYFAPMKNESTELKSVQKGVLIIEGGS